MNFESQGQLPFVGLINVLKLPGMSSHSVISRIRNIYNIKRVGHTGTLDPYAGGILLVALGPATRLCDYLDAVNKTYRAEITIGYHSISADAEKAAIKVGDVKNITDEDIFAASREFLGTITQTPPIFSALSIDGKRAYEFARDGKEVKIKTRQVDIEEFNILNITRENDRIKVMADITCSKGTYIRSIASDFGEKLGVGGMLSFLLRTKTAGFELKDAITCDELFEIKREGNGEEFKYIMSPDVGLTHIEEIVLGQEHDNYRGGTNIKTEKANGLYRVYIEEDFLGLGTVTDGILCPKVNLTGQNIPFKTKIES